MLQGSDMDLYKSLLINIKMANSSLIFEGLGFPLRLVLYWIWSGANHGLAKLVTEE